MQIGRIEFMKAIKGVGKLTGTEVDEFVVEIFCEAVEPHGWHKGVEAFKRLALSSRRFPTVFDLLEIVAPAEVARLDDTDEAALAAGRAWDAIGKYGSREANEGYPKARSYIGELGWAVVGPNWQRICEDTKSDDKATMKAQWRQEIKATLARARAQLPIAPGLPGGQSADLYLPPSRAALMPETPRVLDRQSMAAGEKDDESIDLW